MNREILLEFPHNPSFSISRARGYITEEHITVYSFLPVRVHDKIKYSGEDYEVITVDDYDLNGDPIFYKSACKRLITQ